MLIMLLSIKSQYFDGALLHLSVEMTGQSVIKHFLTEGDKFLVSRLSPLADQGGYAVASNYGWSLKCILINITPEPFLRFPGCPYYLPTHRRNIQDIFFENAVS